ncbi:MAG: hypothetical protein AAF499_16625 [Pseudomonadota bacterium]
MSNHSIIDPARQALGLRGILLATVGAALVALVLLVTVVAPAEYGYDPTGIGKRIGMDRLYHSAPAARVLWDTSDSRQSDSARVTLAAGEGVEVKALMQEGQQLLYNWAATGGPVYLELHGDPTSGAAYSSYKVIESSERGQGGLTAPFDGLHGWYWRNDGASDVLITLDTTGYYDLLRID